MTLTASIRYLILPAMCLTMVGCRHHSSAPIPAFVWQDPYVTHRLRYGGTRCEFDDWSVHLGSPSYPIEAIGKPETPSVGSGDRSLVREIRRDAPHLRFLRFTT